MQFHGYVQRQKSLIRERHAGETFLISKGEEIRLRDTEEIFCELERMEGLNRFARELFSSFKKTNERGELVC